MKGILFKPDMIEAIGAGKKTMTRRVMKPQPILCISDEQFKENLSICGLRPHTGFGQRYAIGEVVYIKEVHYQHGHYEGSHFVHSLVEGVLFDPPEIIPDSTRHVGWHLRSPMFMPAMLARYFIRIIDVRAEKLQEITEEDAFKEGFKNLVLSDMNPNFNIKIKPASHNFRDYWDYINKPPYGWNSNCWAWVYSFKKKTEKGE